jgi:hypothetical protein
VAQNFAVRREIRAMKTIFNVDYSAIPVDDFTQTIASQLTLVNADCECRFFDYFKSFCYTLDSTLGISRIMKMRSNIPTVAKTETFLTIGFREKMQLRERLRA